MSVTISVVFTCTAALSCLLGLNASNVLSRCHAQCRVEEELKASCKAERNCDSLLPNFDAFLRCVEPCRDIGSNCFQRCAFDTDFIADTCLRQCQVTGETADVSGGQSLMEATPAGKRHEENMHVISGHLCYKSCYDRMLNSAMNRIYIKPTLEN